MPEDTKDQSDVPKPEGEFIVVPSKTAVDPDFFKALMAFQYGEGEESDAGFEKMKRSTQTPPSEP